MNLNTMYKSTNQKERGLGIGILQSSQINEPVFLDKFILRSYHKNNRTCLTLGWRSLICKKFSPFFRKKIRDYLIKVMLLVNNLR